GSLQRFLDTHHIKHTGADTLSAALSLKKHRSKSIFDKWELRHPRSRTLFIDNPEAQAYELFKTFTIPLVIKPIGGGSSHGVQVALSFPRLVEIFETL